MIRKKKSVKLERSELKELGKIVRAAHTLQDAADEIGVHRSALERILLKGSGSPENIEIVRKAITAKVDA